MMRRGLSLVEALIVIMVIGLLAILAVPRLSHADPEPRDFDPRPALVTLRTAIELYYYDHGVYPGRLSDGVSPPGSAEAFCNQLTAFSDAAGRTSAEKTDVFQFGPYLRDGIPPCPVPPRLGRAGVVTTGDVPCYQEFAVEAGWVYNCQTGAVAVNSDVRDADSLPYDQY